MSKKLLIIALFILTALIARSLPAQQIVNGGFQFTPLTVGSLPSASTDGRFYVVSDSTSIVVEGQTCVGSGSTTAYAFSNGGVWSCFSNGFGTSIISGGVNGNLLKAIGLNTATDSGIAASNVPLLNGNNALTGNETHSGTTTFKNINNRQFCDQFLGATADVKIAACIAALPTTGGTADATGLVTSQSLLAQVSIPANVTLVLAPIAYSFNVGANACAFALTGNGAKLIGHLSANASLATTAWTGTILQAASPTATTRGVCGPNASSAEAIEIDDIAVDMVPAGGATTAGSDCFSFLGVSNSNFNNVYGYHCGGNGFVLGTSSANAHAYQDTVHHGLMRFVALDGWLLTTAASSANADIDLFTCDTCEYHAYDASSSVTRSGTNGVHIQISSGAGAASSIDDLIFRNLRVFGTVSGASNYGFFIDEASNLNTNYVKNIHCDNCEIEGGFSADAGTGLFSNGTATNLVDTIFFEPLLFANWATNNNLNTTNANNFRISDQSTGVTYASSLLFQNRSTLGGVTNSPGGGLAFQSSSGGSYRLGIDSGGIVRWQRTDIGPTDLWCFSGQVLEIYPCTDKTAAIGDVNAAWANIWTYSIGAVESTAPSSVASRDVCYGDSTAHALKCSYNNGPFNVIGFESTTSLSTGSGGGNYTGTNTSFANVDTTNLCQVVTVPTGWKLIIQTSGSITTNTGVATASVGITDIGTTCGGSGVTPLKQQPIQPAAAAGMSSFSLSYVLNGDGAAHSISLQANTNNASDAWAIQDSSTSNSPSLVLQLVMSN